MAYKIKSKLDKRKRLEISLIKLRKASEQADIERYRTKRAEKGDVFGALFGKPPKKKK